MTLRTRVMLSFLLVVALTLGASGYIFLHYFEGSFCQSTIASLVSISQARAESIGDDLREDVGDLLSESKEGAERVRDIVNKHGREIGVASEVGKGTTFVIDLPLKGEGDADG